VSEQAAAQAGLRGYREPGSGYGSLAWVAVLLVAAFGVDVGIGGAWAHLPGWIVAAVVLLGADLVMIRAARMHKTLDVNATEIRIGDEAVPRDAVRSAVAGVDRELPVLGWPSGHPRGRRGVIVSLADGRQVVVPTRAPDAVLAALGTVPSAGPAVPIREAEPADLPLLAEIGERAGVLFRVAGYPMPAALAAADVDSAAALFVAGRPPVGFARVDEVDGLAHLTEVAVLPGSMKQGIGSRLLDRVCAWARDAGYPAITLTAYADVPWNGPMYARRGWVETAELTDGLRALRAREVARGLDRAGRRIVMRRPL